MVRIIKQAKVKIHHGVGMTYKQHLFQLNYFLIQYWQIIQLIQTTKIFRYINPKRCTLRLFTYKNNSFRVRSLRFTVRVHIFQQ